VTLLLLLGGTTSTSLAASFAGDFTFDGVKRPEFVYLALEGTDNQGTPTKEGALAKWRTASATSAANSQGRLRQLVSIVAGKVYVQGLGVWTEFTDPVLSPAAAHYWGVVHSQKLYMGDGLTYVVYDPKAGTLEEWQSEGSGSIPEKCALATVYNSRLILARPDGQKQNWYMSEIEKPGDFDFFPPTITVTQAVAGNNAEAGNCPDIINTMIPHNDDLLIFGCDSSIWVLRGDPLSGGRFDRVSDSTGMAFGNSWCKDPTGIIYFFGSKGGVYRMAPGGVPQYLSDARDGQSKSIQTRLTGIDLGKFKIEMQWDFERQGLIVVQIPYDLTATSASLAWFWDSKNNAWWEDDLGTVGLQPYTTFVADGDLPGDRRVVFGCQDGYLRELDSTATSDDGTAIDAYVTIGPISAGSGVDAEVMVNRIKAVLASELFGCTYEVYSSDTPGDLGNVVASGDFPPGQSLRMPVRKRGAYIWIKLRNKATGQRFAVEELIADLGAAGLRRQRA